MRDIAQEEAHEFEAGCYRDSLKEQRQRCVVRYQIATYSGEEIIYCNSNDEIEVIIAKCKRQLSRDIPLPFGYQSFKIIEREDYFGD